MRALKLLLLASLLAGASGAVTNDREDRLMQRWVRSKPVVREIVIEGNSSVRRNDILDTILLKNGDMVNKAKLSVDVEAIRVLYLEKGYPDVDVKGRIERDDETTATVVFTIDEGSQRANWGNSITMAKPTIMQIT